MFEEGKTVGAVARDLDLTETALREWVKRAQADRTKGRTGLTTAEREELTRLRRENRIPPKKSETSWKKSNGVLREAEPMRFAFIAAKKAEHRVHQSLPLHARDPQWVLRVAPPVLSACGSG